VRALDTNVLVRALVADDEKQSPRAAEVLKNERFFVPVTVVLELEWVLRSRYRLGSAAVADAIARLTRLENAVIGESAAVAAAAAMSHSGWDFADALHHALSHGCESFATFDDGLVRRAKKARSLAPPVVAL
jgi:predicted nucleic-acid-binding protein